MKGSNHETHEPDAHLSARAPHTQMEALSLRCFSRETAAKIICSVPLLHVSPLSSAGTLAGEPPALFMGAPAGSARGLLWSGQLLFLSLASFQQPDSLKGIGLLLISFVGRGKMVSGF